MLIFQEKDWRNYMKMNKIWEIWKYSLGSFSDDKTAPYDNYVAIIRTSIFVSYMVTNAFIISGVIRHWDKVNSNVVTGTNPQVSLCIGNRTCKESRTNVVTSGWYGKNYGTEIRTVEKRKMQGKSGAIVLQNSVKW